MLLLHAHWESPLSPTGPGGFLFWAETSESPQPKRQRGRLAQHPEPKEHPFCAPLEKLRVVPGNEAEERTIILRLPSSRTGPRPTPGLIHSWDLDDDTPPLLAPWIVSGVWLPCVEAWHLLLELPTRGTFRDDGGLHLALGDDVRLWNHAAALVLETLAAQKLVPVLASPDGKTFHARWLPVLDSAKDGPRLARLEAAMPPICRAAISSSTSTKQGNRVQPAPGNEHASPRSILTSFLNTTCDALARRWGRQAAAHILRTATDPEHRWLAALFTDNPVVKASPAQLQAMAMSHRAWMRNLHVAGDAAFRIAFRLEAPSQSKNPAWQLHYLLQARDDPGLLVSAKTVWDKAGSVLTKLGRHFEQPQEKMLAGLGYAARLFPPIAGTLRSKRPTQLSLDTSQAYTFLRETAPLLEGAGFGLLVPPWWNKPGARLGLRLKMRTPGDTKTQQGKMTLENLVGYQWELAVGETTLTEEEFRALAELKTPLVQIRGQWVQLDAEQIEAAIRFWEKQQREGEMDILEALQFGLGGETEQNGLPVDEVDAEGWFGEFLERVQQEAQLQELSQPSGLQGQLRPYQRYGFSWLAFHRRWGLGACLADDMGLGKTIQTISLLLHEKEARGELPAPTLLICPTSVVTNWEREVARFAPALTTLVHQGAGRLRGGDFLEAVQGKDMVLTSYALARMDAEILQSIDWLGVVLDEAQNIKNPGAKQTQAIRKLKAGFRFALTGTPVENRLSELWSIMHFLNPGYLGSRRHFRAEYGLPIERYQDGEALQRLKRLTAPFILRRVKTDPTVIQDLPDKVETKVYCHLTDEQASLYEAVVQDALQKIEATEEGIERRGMVLSMLMQLKQICNHPTQYFHQGEIEGGGEIGAFAGRSGKVERLTELIEELLAAGDRALIFTQFAEMGNLLAGYLNRNLGVATQFLHGGTPAQVRDRMVRRFQEEPHAPPIFILSLKAGGTGLNLTRANHVFHFDRWWNPAVEDQATDRAFRIGQKRNVLVHKFITTGTLEEMVDDMIESKKELAQAVVGRGEGWLTELGMDDLRELVRLRKA